MHPLVLVFCSCVNAPEAVALVACKFFGVIQNRAATTLAGAMMGWTQTDADRTNKQEQEEQ